MSYIQFIEGPPKPLTKTWDIVPIHPPFDSLGSIRWHGPWRCYSYFPDRDRIIILEKKCLRDIADFCEQQTLEQRRIKR